MKWVFFEQVARLTGSPAPERPTYEDRTLPTIKVFGLEPGQVLKGRSWVEAIVTDNDPRWPIKRVEFFIDDKPYSYRTNAPFYLGGQEWWDALDITPGPHTLRVVAYDMRGPRFTSLCSILARFHFPLKGRKTMKHAIITSFLGKLRDRFCEYQEPLSIEQKLERMAQIPGVTGAEVVHPYEVDTAEIMLAPQAAKPEDLRHQRQYQG